MLGFLLVIAPNFLMIIAVVLALIGIIAYSSYQANEKRGKQINDTIQKAADALVQVKEDGNMEVGIIAGEVANTASVLNKRAVIAQASALNSDDPNVVMAALIGKPGGYTISDSSLYHESLFDKLIAPDFKCVLRFKTDFKRIYEITEGKTRFILIGEKNHPWRGQYLVDSEGKRSEYYWKVDVCISLENCDQECVTTLSNKLRDTLETSKLEMIRENPKEIRNFVASLLGLELKFSLTSMVPHQLTNDQLSHYYAPVEYTVGDQKVSMNMKDFVDATVKALSQKLNVFLCGRPGTGKTCLATFVLGQLSLNENTTIVTVNEKTLEAITGSNSYQFQEFLEQYAKGENRVVMYMDEGHQAVVNNHDGLKSLLDGTLSGTYNLSFFTSMNSTEEYLRKEKGELSREGRVEIFTIKPLTAAQANVAASFVGSQPSMERVDKNPFTKETTLAQLFRKFVKKEAPNPFLKPTLSGNPVTINL